MFFRCWVSCSSRSILLRKQDPETSTSDIDGIAALELFGNELNSKGLTVTKETEETFKEDTWHNTFLPDINDDLVFLPWNEFSCSADCCGDKESFSGDWTFGGKAKILASQTEH